MTATLLAISGNSPYLVIIAGSLILILSYIFNLISERTSIPSVLLLIVLGVMIQLGLDLLDFQVANLFPALEVLGVVGLIMIVLEAALDLELTRDKLPFIGKALLIALIGLVLSTLAIAGILKLFLQVDFAHSVLLATPLAIMSSAIIIPSVQKLILVKREFMVYESTFSDILGIMLFYFMISFLEDGGNTAILQFGGSLILTIIVAIMASYLLIYFFKDFTGNKLFLLIASLLLLYSLGKIMHLSPLLIILVFGLALSNHQRFFWLFKATNQENDPIERIEKEFHIITMETAFVVRTFFFVIFGMTIQLTELINGKVALIALLVLVALYATRWLVLRILQGRQIIPELWLAPRGLITILLFFAIPHELTVPAFKSGILLYVILISSLLMTWALVRQNRTIAGDKQPRESQPTRPPGETKTNENKEPDSNAPIY
ncbi:MAG: cation:proton antiporter [Saprospiraceae bacterium]